MRAAVKAPHIPLVAVAEPDDRTVLASLLIVAVRLSDGMWPVRLMLDSGTNAPILYDTSQYMALQLFQSVALRGNGVDGAQRVFLALHIICLILSRSELCGWTLLTLEAACRIPFA